MQTFRRPVVIALLYLQSRPTIKQALIDIENIGIAYRTILCGRYRLDEQTERKTYTQTDNQTDTRTHRQASLV